MYTMLKQLLCNHLGTWVTWFADENMFLSGILLSTDGNSLLQPCLGFKDTAKLIFITTEDASHSYTLYL